MNNGKCFVEYSPKPIPLDTSGKAKENNLCRIVDLGLVDYSYAYEFQKQVLDKIRYGNEPHALILCEHPHTITQGRMTKESDLLISPLKLKQLGVSNYSVERGGRITYHGPGQLVAYPVFDLNKLKKDLKFFLWSLEEVIINFLNNFNLEAERKPGYTGVWIEDKKIASIGIAVKKWITFHGLAINLNTDLEYFSLIKPCGLDVRMTSLSQIMGREIVIDNRLKERLVEEFKKVFALEIVEGQMNTQLSER